MDEFFNFFESWRPNNTEEQTFHVEYKRYPYAPKVSLPPPKRLSKSLEGAIRERKTTRVFSPETLTKREISTFLYWSAGRVHRNSGDAENVLRRSFPSGGKRFAVEIYIAILKGKAVPAGVYHYEVETHRLARLSDSNPEKIRAALPYDFAKKAPLLCLFSLNTLRVTKKYGTLGYKLGILEAGHIAQNMYLVGADMNLSTLAIGGMNDALVDTALDFTGSEETIFYQMAVGHPGKTRDNVDN